MAKTQERNFQAISICKAGSYDSSGTFVYGGYSTASGAFGGAISTDAAGKLHGSDFMVDSLEFAVALVGTP